MEECAHAVMSEATCTTRQGHLECLILNRVDPRDKMLAECSSRESMKARHYLLVDVMSVREAAAGN